MCGLPFVPRSPRWLAPKDRSEEEAIATLPNIQARGDKESLLVLGEWDITTMLQPERAAGYSGQLFIYGSMWKQTLAGFMVQMCDVTP